MTLITPIMGQSFIQNGQTYMYNGRNGNTVSNIPISIKAAGSSTTSNDENGFFKLHFNSIHAGDIMNDITVNVLQSGYVWFNKDRVTPWTLTNNRSLPIVLSSAQYINNRSTKYYENYANWYKKKYEVAKGQLRQNISDLEDLKHANEELQRRFEQEMADLRLRSIEFAYVDESQIDSLEYVIREYELSGKIDSAIILGKSHIPDLINNTEINIGISINKAKSDLDDYYRITKLAERHLKNCEQVGLSIDSLVVMYDDIFPRYEKLISLYAPDNIDGFRCSKEFYEDLKYSFGNLLYDYHRNCCSEIEGDRKKHEYWEDRLCPYLNRAAELENISSLYYLADEYFYHDIEKSKEYYNRIVALYLSNGTIRPYDSSFIEEVYEGENRIPSFQIVINQDTVSFHINRDSISVTMCKWYHKNLKNTKISIPHSVTYKGKKYKVTRIGREAMGSVFYGPNEWDDSSLLDSVKEIILPKGLTHIGSYAFNSRFGNMDFKINIPESVEYFGNNCLDASNLVDKHGAIYLPKNLKRICWLGDAEDSEIEKTSLHINEKLEEIGGLSGFSRNQPHFKRVYVDNNNKHFRSVHGALYSYNMDSIYWATVTDTLYIPKKIKVDSNTFSYLADGWYPHLFFNPPVIEVEEGNPYCCAMDNVLYNIVEKRLIYAPHDDSIIVHVPKWCRSIIDPLTDMGVKNFEFDSSASPEDITSFLLELMDIEYFNKLPYTLTYLGESIVTDALDDKIVGNFFSKVAELHPESQEAAELCQIWSEKRIRK